MPAALSSLCLWLPLLAAGAPVHPADGPDADVRILIGRQRVAVSIVVNLAYVDEVVDVPREDTMSLHPVEHEFVRDALLEHFKATNRVAVDGVPVPPVLAEFEVGEPDLSLLPLFPMQGAKALIRVQLLLEYPLKQSPRAVALRWGVFPPDRALVGLEAEAPPMAIQAQLTARGLRSRIAFTADEPEFVWHDSGERLEDRFEPVPPPALPDRWAVSLPAGGVWAAGSICALLAALRSLRRRRGWPFLVVALACGLGGAALHDVGVVRFDDPWSPGPRLPSEQEALAVFGPLHANIYRAFDYAAESDVYDALAASVHGDLLDDLYDQIYRGLVMQEHGGAVCTVQEVRPVATEVGSIGRLPDDGRVTFAVTARWQVDGAVFHWGHSHERTNEYLARYTVAQVGGGWRICGHQPLEQRRVSSTPLEGR